MATCEKREIVQPKPPVEYVLTLSEEEARVLARFIGSGQWPLYVRFWLAPSRPHEDEAPLILNAIFGRMKFAGVLR